jgi:phage baseplate assembly protein W
VPSFPLPLAFPLGGGDELPPVPDPRPPTGEPDRYGTDILFQQQPELTPGGDWQTIVGLPYLRQWIYHCMITRPGEFKLRPQYGVGVQDYVKRPHTKANLDQAAQRTRSALLTNKQIEQVQVSFESRTLPNGTKALVMRLRVRALKRDLHFRPFTFTEKGGIDVGS